MVDIKEINNKTNKYVKYKKFVIKKKDSIYVLYDNVQTHQYICEQAANIFGVDIFGFRSIEDPTGSLLKGYLGNMDSKQEYTICGGAYFADEHCYLWDDIVFDHTLSHYWNPDDSDDEDSAGGLGGVPNAYWQANRLWRERVLPSYISGNKAEAYEYLGHVCHLLGDMNVPAHVHNDLHVGSKEDFWKLLAGLFVGDDCYEDWVWEEGYKKWNYQNVSGGIINIPWYLRPSDVNEDIFPLYYLMYTAAQTGDYFASDDVNGDSSDRRGWMNYLGFPSKPRDSSDLTGGFPGFFDNDAGDNDDDGDLGRIGAKCFTYAIQVTASLYKVFCDTVMPIADIVHYQDGDYTKMSNNKISLQARVPINQLVQSIQFQYKVCLKDSISWINIGSPIPKIEDQIGDVYYSIEWDVTSIPNGEYEIRAVPIKSYDGTFSDSRYSIEDHVVWIVVDHNTPNWLISDYYDNGSFSEDYLNFYNSEKGILPYEGMGILYWYNNQSKIWRSLEDINILYRDLSSEYSSYTINGISYANMYIKATNIKTNLFLQVKSYGHKIYFNGVLVDQVYSGNTDLQSKTVGPIDFKQGWNRILVKMNHAGEERFSVRICDSEGYFIPGLDDQAKAPLITEITSPISGKGIFTNKPMEIRATLSGSDFSGGYVLSYSNGIPLKSDNTNWTILKSDTLGDKITNQTIYTLNTPVFPDGIYTFQLRSRDSFGDIVNDLSTINIDRSLLDIEAMDYTNNVIDYTQNRVTEISINICSNALYKTNLVNNEQRFDGVNKDIWYDAIDGNYTVDIIGYDDSSGALITNTWNMNIVNIVQINSVSVVPSTFDPYVDLNTTVSYSISRNADVEIVVTGTNDSIVKYVKKFDTVNELAGSYSENWNGKNEYGKIIANGIYQVIITCKDEKGNYKRSSRNIIINTSDDQYPSYNYVAPYPYPYITPNSNSPYFPDGIYYWHRYTVPSDPPLFTMVSVHWDIYYYLYSNYTINNDGNIIMTVNSIDNNLGDTINYKEMSYSDNYNRQTPDEPEWFEWEPVQKIFSDYHSPVHNVHDPHDYNYNTNNYMRYTNYKKKTFQGYNILTNVVYIEDDIKINIDSYSNIYIPDEGKIIFGEPIINPSPIGGSLPFGGSIPYSTNNSFSDFLSDAFFNITFNEDTTAPVIENLNLMPSILSPGNESCIINYTTSKLGESTICKIIDEDKNIVKKISIIRAGERPISWNCKDLNGNVVPNGLYTAELKVIDPAGNESLTVSGVIKVKGFPTSAEDGGKVRSEDNHVTLDIPPNALSSNTTINITYILDPPVPPDFTLLGSFFDITPNDLIFNIPVTLTVQYDDSGLTL
ncbi:MAG: hypothetical protein KKH98_09770, partial [Spirochaetes bacterium]|nr:hypothetical protein [Spirochaetota bacterium]